MVWSKFSKNFRKTSKSFGSVIDCIYLKHNNVNTVGPSRNLKNTERKTLFPNLFDDIVNLGNCLNIVS